MTQRKVSKFKYEATALKGCRDTAIMMGEKMVKFQAEEKYVIQKWIKHDGEIEKNDGHMTREMLDKFYPNRDDKEEDEVEEQNQYMLLTNYIDKYQEKLGLYGTKSKKSEVEKVLAFTHKDMARKANEVYIDFESFRQAKVHLQSTCSVRNNLIDKCIKQGLPKKAVSYTHLTLPTICSV